MFPWDVCGEFCTISMNIVALKLISDTQLRNIRLYEHTDKCVLNHHFQKRLKVNVIRHSVHCIAVN